MAPRSADIWNTATTRPPRAGLTSATSAAGTLARNDAPSPKVAIDSRKTHRAGGRTRAAVDAVASEAPRTSAGRRPQVSAGRPERRRPNAWAAEPASSPAPAQATVRPNSSVTYRGTSELRTPKRNQPTPRLATSAARYTRDRSAVRRPTGSGARSGPVPAGADERCVVAAGRSSTMATEPARSRKPA